MKQPDFLVTWLIAACFFMIFFQHQPQISKINEKEWEASVYFPRVNAVFHRFAIFKMGGCGGKPQIKNWKTHHITF